jgi:hypothetical protein
MLVAKDGFCVTLSAAKRLAKLFARFFASLRMTGRILLGTTRCVLNRIDNYER